ncbi:MAG: class I SAM-dependent methyltransferase [Thermoanaerobaculia bacterium]
MAGVGSPGEAYDAFAYAYDQALGERFFSSVARLLDRVEREHPPLAPSPTHLDVACGTGRVVEYFTRRGYRSTGFDASLPMLRLGRERASRLVAGDMRTSMFRGRFDRITCLYDSLNHLLEREDLVAAFRSVASMMHPGSLYCFDVNHPAAYPRIWGVPEPFISRDDDHYLSLDTAWSAERKLGRARATGWANLKGKRVRIDEIHLQRPWSEEEISSALSAAGLEASEISPFDPFDGLHEDEPVKIFFLAGMKKSA